MRTAWSILCVAIVGGAVSSCGGGGGGKSPTDGGGGIQTRTFSGSTQATGPGSCISDSHDFVAAQGVVSVTLVQSTGSTALSVQVCAGGIDNNQCTINQTVIAVGQTLTGTRKGISSQNLKLLPLTCSPAGGPVPPGPILYTVTVTYPG